jgi:hypothetical protein
MIKKSKINCFSIASVKLVNKLGIDSILNTNNKIKEKNLNPAKFPNVSEKLNITDALNVVKVIA